jgi:hypothetical protein
MTYELAKQLKDVGFPQKDRLEPMFYDTGKGQSAGKFEMLFVPNLSELIESCGDKFAHLKRYYPSGVWEAATDGFEQQAHSPEEAVAKLWLELNKNGTGTN